MHFTNMYEKKYDYSTIVDVLKKKTNAVEGATVSFTPVYNYYTVGNLVFLKILQVIVVG